MCEISFIHLSDIHFRKNSNNPADIDKDLRDAIIYDLKYNATNILKNIKSVLVCGDIAFSGNENEYSIADRFLKEVTQNLGIKENDVFCVPGNHDIDQSVPNRSDSVYKAQKDIENADNIDEADAIFERKITDICNKELLFQPLNSYNEFASKFSCRTDADKVFWDESFDMGYNTTLHLFGINSCIISNADDHNNSSEERLMYIGQSQIPPISDSNTVYLTMCHHPPKLWKFQKTFITKFNKRADIQLYGHMHVQAAEFNDNNVILYSGAVHPERGKDWIPIYNWISLEVYKEQDSRILKIKIFPRILSNDRNCFTVDSSICGHSKQYKEHTLNIDKKREHDLRTTFASKQSLNQFSDNYTTANSRDLVYKFLSLPRNTQTKIIKQLSLLDTCDIGKKYEPFMSTILENVEQNGKICDFKKLLYSDKGV